MILMGAPESIPPGRGEITDGIDFLSGEVERLGVELRLNKPLDEALLDTDDAEALTSSQSPDGPNISGRRR